MLRSLEYTVHSARRNAQNVSIGPVIAGSKEIKITSDLEFTLLLDETSNPLLY